MAGLDNMRRELREKYERLMTDEAWQAAEESLRKYGYSKVTIDIMDRVLPEWRTVIEEFAIDRSKAERSSTRYVPSLRFRRRSVRDVLEDHREDEFYVLVMRYVPIEIRRHRLKVREVFDEWDRDLAPSPNLIRWWKEGPRTPERWKEYEKRHLKEVPPALIERKADIHKGLANERKVVFVCREEDWEYPYCHTWIILNVIEREKR